MKYNVYVGNDNLEYVASFDDNLENLINYLKSDRFYNHYKEVVIEDISTNELIPVKTL